MGGQEAWANYALMSIDTDISISIAASNYFLEHYLMAPTVLQISSLKVDKRGPNKSGS